MEDDSTYDTKTIVKIQLPAHGFFHSLSWWKQIFPFLDQTTYDRYLTRCQCTLFRDALPPLPKFWMIFPTPKFVALEDLVLHLNQVWENDPTKAPRLVIHLSNQVASAVVSEYVPCFEGFVKTLSNENPNDGFHIKRTYQLREINCVAKQLVREFPEESETYLGTPKLPICAACLKPCKGKKHCSNCKLVKYCTRDCQKKHWSHHKPNCNRLKKLGGKTRLSRMNMIGRTLFANGNFFLAESVARRVVAGYEKLLGSENVETLHSLGNLATLLKHNSNKMDEAETIARLVLKTSERVLKQDHQTILESLSALGVLLFERGKLEEAEALLRRAVEAYNKQPSLILFSIVALETLASLLNRRKEYEESEALLHYVWETKESFFGMNHPDTLKALNNLGSVFMCSGKYEQAETLFRRALELSEEALGTNNNSTTTESLGNLATALQKNGKFEEAEDKLRRLLEVAERKHGQEHSITMFLLGKLADVLRKNGKLKESEDKFRSLLKAADQTLELPDSFNMMRLLHNFGTLLQKNGKFEEAEDKFRRLLAAAERKYGPNGSNTHTALCFLGSVLKESGQLDDAEAQYRRALKGKEEVLGLEDESTMICLNNLGMLLQKRGKLEEAEVMLRCNVAREENIYQRDPSKRAIHNARGNLGILLMMKNKDDEGEEEGRDMVKGALAALTSPPHLLPETHHWIQKFQAALE